MTRQEAEGLLCKSPDSLTSRDIAILNHISVMVKIVPDYLDTPEVEVYSSSIDVTIVDSVATRSFIVWR